MGIIKRQKTTQGKGSAYEDSRNMPWREVGKQA
jgi:hypothetical protein